MKYLIKNSYNETNMDSAIPDNLFHVQEAFPFNKYSPPGQTVEESEYGDKMEDHQKDGKDFEEFKVFERKKRRDKLKKLLKKKKKDKPLEPAPFYSSMYGYTGFEGMYTSPLEYYGGGTSDDGTTTNPFNNTFQSSSTASHSRLERLRIRGMIFNDFITKT